MGLLTMIDELDRKTAHLTNNTIIKITWKNDEPIWTEQWPLTKEKLQVAKELPW